MVLPDVNVLVYAHRADSTQHSGCRDWMESVINGDEAYGLAELVLSGFIRIVAHPKVFNKTSPLVDALAFTAPLRGRPNRIIETPAPASLRFPRSE